MEKVRNISIHFLYLDDSKYIEFVEGNVTSLETIPTDAIHDVKYVIFVAGSSPSQARFTSNTPYHVGMISD